MSINHLVGNGSHLYRRSSHLVRTPIVKTITLAPDEMAYYDVAGSYNSAMPTAGVIADSEHYSQIALVGKKMRKYYLNQTTRPSQYQIWRQVTTSHEPEFIFYQGAYSTAAGNTRPEAFMKLCAYHFTIPAQYAPLAVASATLKITHGGTILQHYGATVQTVVSSYMPQFAANASTSLLEANSEWRTGWVQQFGLYQTLNNEPSQMHEQALQDITLDTHLTQGTLNNGVTNGRLIWDNTYVSYTDGYIPVTNSPWVQSVALEADMLYALNGNRGGWIVGTPNVSTSTNASADTANDYPFYDPGSSNPAWWLCCSYWGFALQVTLSI